MLPHHRSARRRLVALACLLALLVVPGGAPSQAGPGDPPVPDDDTFVGAGGYTYPRPTNAAKVFRWGSETWRDEFEVGGALRPQWRVNRPRRVREQQGQITMNAQAHTGTVSVTATDTAAAYGRWETRVRGKRYDRGTPYRFFWELVPVQPTGCPGGSDQRIVIASWAQDDARAVGGIGVDADTAFTFGADLDLRIGYFHTYAIEIAPDHVSWFVDTKVVHTERRPEALTGVVYRPRLRMQAVRGATMARSRMQADWVRHYSLDRPGALPVTAPAMTRTDLAPLC
ncbi:family 16 glycosylhydrolase [Nocardioides dongxiaopingii]|uniref:family 16 glycosylhydrolase n=1 Tax=Nocardioides TaxID=1839 RepID=UPI00110DC041|nr:MULTISPECIES: family 16 glycosylhydrolase [Nocardioides]